MSFKETIEKITSSRVFTVVLCLVLCASLLFSYATPRAQAIAIADDIAIGILALLLLATAGVVIHVNNQNQMSAVGNSFKTSMYQWGTSAEKLDEVDEFFGGLTLHNPDFSEPDDDGEEDPRREVRLARGILAGIASWIASVCIAGKLNVGEEATPEGYAYYNGYLLPDLSKYLDEGLMVFATNNPDGSVVVTANTGSRVFSKSDEYYGYRWQDARCYDHHQIVSALDAWDELEPWYLSYNTTSYTTDFIAGYDPAAEVACLIYSSFDVIIDGVLVMEGTSPSLVDPGDEDLPTSFVTELPNQIQAGVLGENALVLPDIIDYGAIMQDGMTLEDSVVDTLNQLSTGTKDHNEFVRETTFAEYPVFTQNLPLLPSMSRVYSVGEKADTFTVEATANGTLLYEWLDTSVVPYAVLGTGPSFTPDTSRETTYNLACRVTNTVPCSFIETGYVTNASYSATYKIIVQADPVVDPNPDPGTDPNPDPGVDPDPDPGTDPNPDPGTDPNPDPGTDPGSDPSVDSSVDAGQQYVDELTGMIPNNSQGFVDALGSLADSLGYTGTECVLPIPALKLPALGGLFPSYTVMQAQEVDFEEMIGMLPPNLLLLVRSLLTIALIAYCFKELYSTFSYFFVLKGGKA